MGTPATTSRRPRLGRHLLVGLATLALLTGLVPGAFASDGLPSTDDPRAGLAPGFDDAGEAALGFERIGGFDKRDGNFFEPTNVGAFGVANSDLAFTGDHVIQGNFAGFQIFDVSDPANPALRTEVRCPGGQHDATVYGDLLFISVESAAARIDCEAGPVDATTRFRGIRIFDISDLDDPVQVGGIQTCRGSHTHRLVEDPSDPDHVYLYNSGTAGQRSAAEFVHTPDGFVNNRCGQTSAAGPNPSQWMIEVVKVPVANPGAAAVVREARLFQNPETGAFNGLQNGPTRVGHPCSTTPNPITGTGNSCAPAGTGYSPSPNTNTCHDITVYPEVGLALGACQGNGILIDISDPSNPVRLDAVADENFSYWHSANFNNDGTAAMFTDEWGGGTGGRCAPAHRLEWGANALFNIVEGEDGSRSLEFASYFKMPAAQEAAENCVAHQANIVPVPGRDILVQGWYQGGISMFDWTDPAEPFEIGYFDRGRINVANLVTGAPTTGTVLGGFWSGYWYNGKVYGSEIARGLDVFELTPTAALTANEIAAANTVRWDEHNAMSLRRITWEPSFEVVRAFTDQAERANMPANTLANVRRFTDRAEQFRDGPQRRAAIANLRAVSNQVEAAGFDELAGALRDLAASLE